MTLIVSNIAATKLISMGLFNVTLDGGVILFPLSYILGDIITEVYGFKTARKLVLVGFLVNILTAFIFYMVQLLPASPEWHNQSAYESILGMVPRIVFASMIAYLLGELSNSFVLARMKVLTKGKYLWARTLGSTLVGALVDTTLFGFIAFGGVISNGAIVGLVVTGYILKFLIEALITPLTYIVVRYLKRIQGNDHFDTRLRLKNILQ